MTVRKAIAPRHKNEQLPVGKEDDPLVTVRWSVMCRHCEGCFEIVPSHGRTDVPDSIVTSYPAVCCWADLDHMKAPPVSPKVCAILRVMESDAKRHPAHIEDPKVSSRALGEVWFEKWDGWCSGWLCRKEATKQGHPEDSIIAYVMASASKDDIKRMVKAIAPMEKKGAEDFPIEKIRASMKAYAKSYKLKESMAGKTTLLEKLRWGLRGTANGPIASINAEEAGKLLALYEAAEADFRGSCSTGCGDCSLRNKPCTMRNVRDALRVIAGSEETNEGLRNESMAVAEKAVESKTFKRIIKHRQRADEALGPGEDE